MSPLQTKSGIVVQVGDDRGGSLIALDPATGKERWTAAVRGPGYASPIEVTLAGVAPCAHAADGQSGRLASNPAAWRRVIMPRR